MTVGVTPTAVKGQQFIDWIGTGVKLGAEVGVKSGRTSLSILENLPDTIMLLIDSWRDLPGGIVYGNELHNEHLTTLLAKLEPHVVQRAIILRTVSNRAAAMLKEELLDFVILDADHSTDIVYNYCLWWWDTVRPNGWLGGRHYKWGRRGIATVKEAVDKFAIHKGSTAKLETVSTAWRLTKCG